MRLSGGAGPSAKSRRQKAGRAKPQKKATAAARGRGSSVAKLQGKLDALRRELTESLQQQTATADVLKIISRSPADAQPVFDMIAQSAARLCGAQFCHVFRFDGELIHFVAHHGLPPERVETLRRTYPIPPGRRSATARAILNRDIEQIADVQADPDYERERVADIALIRSFLSVPMLKDGSPVGAITLARTQAGNFPARQIELLKTFADQAVIAIENARWFKAEQERTRELTESLQQQTATADVLKVISRSAFDLQTVLDTLVESAARLCEADSAGITRPRDGVHYHVAQYGGSSGAFNDIKAVPLSAGRGSLVGRVLLEGRTVQIPDALADPEYAMLDIQKAIGFRTLLGVPLLREGQPIGVINLWRREVRPFTDKQIELVQTFADQAVIAIENVRLFEAEQQRTRELTESLQQQTATADVLKVISRSTFDLQAVLDTLVESAARLCEADAGHIARPNEAGFFQTQAVFGHSTELQEGLKRVPFKPGRDSVTGRALLELRTVQIVDAQTDPEYKLSELQELGGYRSMIGAPLLREGVPIGVFGLARFAVRPFTDKQMALLTTFADQAVIAIENTRLFEAEQQRARELTESLQQQTATADVLKVISRSTFDLQTVLDTLVESAAHLCEADRALIYRTEGEFLIPAAAFNVTSELREFLRQNPIRPGRDSCVARTALQRHTIHVEDALADPEYSWGAKDVEPIRTVLGVPLLKGDELVGVIVLYKHVMRPFTDKQIELVTTFADQAVIAIENARLLNELRESLQQQTATADVLKVISQSTFDLQRVLDTLVESAAHLCEADSVGIMRPQGAYFRFAAQYGYSPAFVEHMNKIEVGPSRESATGRVLSEGRVIHIPDVLADPDYGLSEAQRIAGFRTVLGVPLLREGTPIGVMNLTRSDARPFTNKQIELVSTFADQAVIAIENVRLFEAEQQRTRELTESLQQQTATADVLKVISQSTFQLQPVFDAIVQTAGRLCDADTALIFMFREQKLHLVATNNASDAFINYIAEHPHRLERGSLSGRVLIERKTIHIPDCLADPEYTARDHQAIGKYRSILGVPLLREDVPIGVICLLRMVVMPFTERQIDLVKTFADQAVIAIENVRLFDELQARTDELSESLQQQTATADVLKVISHSTFELQTVLDALVESATRLCNADHTWLFQREGENFRWVASFGLAADVHARLRDFLTTTQVQVNRGSITGRVALEARAIHVPDVLADPEYTYSVAQNTQKIGGYRAALGVPLLRQGEVVGVLFIAKTVPQPFTEKQIELATTFADQAVIAIENTRLLNELRESLQQQTATADVLKVISRSTFDLQVVLDTLVKSAVQLCEADQGMIARPNEGGFFQTQAHFGHSTQFKEELDRIPFKPGRDSLTGRALLERTTVRIVDAQTDPEYKLSELQRLVGNRSMIGTPLLREGTPIGVFALARRSVRPFTDKQMALLTTFADQAVIAIENARLFDEVRARTDELSESLRQQTATADVLQVISRSAFDLQPVFDTVAESSVKLCEAERALIWRYDGELLRMVAAFNSPPEFREWVAQHPLRPGRHSAAARAALERRTIHIPDVQADPDYSYGAKDVKAVRTVLGVPILKGDDLLGVIIIYRFEVRPFTDKQIALVETFADQSAIAIENVGLFEEVQARTEELTESLQQQTATADVLKVISRSTFDLQTVLDTLVESATRLCDAGHTWLCQREGEYFRWVAGFGNEADVHARIKDYFSTRRTPVDRSSVTGRAALEGGVVHVPDVLADPEYTWNTAQEIAGYRAALGVPLLRKGKVVGVLFIAKTVPQPFTAKQIELATTFADQAVIAIENTRLLNELRESLQQQTATADVLKVISRSAFDLPTVLQTLVESAARLCEADKANIIRQKGAGFYVTEACGYSQEFMEAVKDLPIEPTSGLASGRALLEGQIVHIPDVEADADYTFVAKSLGGIRTILAVPMLREREAIGVLVVTRSDVRPFTDKQIETAQTFADQAAIAIENVRLFDSVEARTRELAASLEELRTAQDRLVQTEKLASLGQLTAGIAHEIKNPLNFVNNFSSLGIELIGELEEALKAPRLDDKIKAQIAELADMLKGNLGKVVEHGKRADSIVKNMLLHSRQEAGEHRPAEINALVAESLNLAYHGARAAKQGFNVTLEQSLDPAAGIVDVFPQEITRVLLNLISNGFYAAAKRKAETNSETYEPTLTASTRNLGDSVEIRIRDNGTGIPAEVRDKLFNPFFTTKPPGEGTGLGLSLSYDIIVKQHGGSIRVDTEPGEFTEFTIVLPRVAASIANSGERR